MNKNLYEQFRTKKPRYPKMYEESVIKELAAKGTDSGTHQDTYERGKFFYNLYQCYIYAAFIGIRLNKRQPFDKKDGKDFAEIFWWESTAKDIVKYLFTGLVALSDKSLMDIQEMDDDKDINDYANELVNDLEEYAAAGFQELYERLESNPHAFQDEFAAMNFLFDLENAPEYAASEIEVL